jgi:hypothetical protein
MQEYLEWLYAQGASYGGHGREKPKEYEFVQEVIASVTEQLNLRQSQLEESPRKIEMAKLRNDLETVMEETAKQPAIREIIPVLERMKRHAEKRFYALGDTAIKKLKQLESSFADLKKSIQDIFTLRKNVETYSRSVFSSNQKADDEETLEAIAQARGHLVRDYGLQENALSELALILNRIAEDITFLRELAYPFEISAENQGVYHRAHALLKEEYAPQFIEQARADHREYLRLRDERWQRAEEAERLADEEEKRQAEEKALAWARPWAEEFNHAHPERQRILARSKPDYVLIANSKAQVTPGIRNPQLSEE